MSLHGEFCCCHLVLGIFRPQIHVFWGPMGKKMRSSENEDYIRYVVLIFGSLWVCWEHCVLREKDSMYFLFLEIRENHLVLIFQYSWKPKKMDHFCGLNSVLGRDWDFEKILGSQDIPWTRRSLVISLSSCYLRKSSSKLFTLKISWKSSPGWLQLVFHFSTENRADQLKKPPCMWL